MYSRWLPNYSIRAAGRLVQHSLLAVLLLSAATAAHAARVDDLYGATVMLPRGGQMNGAFNEALSTVLVKVTGLPELGAPAARRSLFPDAASVVQSYSRLPDNEVRVDFDPQAIRTVLDRAGQPVWGDQRPLIALWLAVDEGGGQRILLGEQTDNAQLEQVRDDLRQEAEQRGLPIVIPLADAQDLRQVTFSDLWGDFREPVVIASQRYGAEAVLIGRTRSLDANQQGVRWTLVAGDEQASWQGTLASGPEYAAEFLAQRLATFADAADAIRVQVSGVADLGIYGQLRNYFRSLNIVESATVAGVDTDTVEFELVVRGDIGRLQRTLNASRNLALVSESAVTTGAETGRRADLTYAWSP